jgi:hypothetical protein
MLWWKNWHLVICLSNGFLIFREFRVRKRAEEITSTNSLITFSILKFMAYFLAPNLISILIGETIKRRWYTLLTAPGIFIRSPIITYLFRQNHFAFLISSTVEGDVGTFLMAPDLIIAFFFRHVDHTVGWVGFIAECVAFKRIGWANLSASPVIASLETVFFNTL